MRRASWSPSEASQLHSSETARELASDVVSPLLRGPRPASVRVCNCDQYDRHDLAPADAEVVSPPPRCPRSQAKSWAIGTERKAARNLSPPSKRPDSRSRTAAGCKATSTVARRVRPRVMSVQARKVRWNIRTGSQKPESSDRTIRPARGRQRRLHASRPRYVVIPVSLDRVRLRRGNPGGFRDQRRDGSVSCEHP